MADFKPFHEQIQSEPAEPSAEIEKVEQETRFDVEGYSIPDFRERNRPGYQDVKKRYGSLSPTDSEHRARTRRDARFKLNPLLKEPLSIVEEERRVIEEKVRKRVAATADEAREKAAKEGYEEGLKRGHHEAFQKFQGECAVHLERIESLIEAFEGARKEVYQANEQALIELIFHTAKSVLLRELQTDREYVTRLARELVERVGTRENIRIRIHPNDRESIDMLKAGLAESFGNLGNVAIEVSEQVRQGGCVVESEWSAIDASVGMQLKKIHAALTGTPSGGTEGA